MEANDANKMVGRATVGRSQDQPVVLVGQALAGPSVTCPPPPQCKCASRVGMPLMSFVDPGFSSSMAAALRRKRKLRSLGKMRGAHGSTDAGTSHIQKE